MGHRAKADLSRATIRLIRQETRIRFTRRHLIRSIHPGPDLPAVSLAPHLRAAILTPAGDRRVGVLPGATVAAVAAPTAPAVVAAWVAVGARAVVVVVAQVAVVAEAHIVEAVVAALIIEFSTLSPR